MEFEMYDLLLYFLIPLFIGSAIGISFAMLYVKEDEFHPRTISDDEGEFIHLGWIGYAIFGLFGSLVFASLGQMLGFGFKGTFVFIVFGGYLGCKFLQDRRKINSKEG